MSQANNGRSARLASDHSGQRTVDFDAWVLACLNFGCNLNGEVEQVSEFYRILARQMARAPSEDRARILEEALDALPEDERNELTEAIAAANPNAPAPEPEAEPWESPALEEHLPAAEFPIDVFPLGLVRLIREGAVALQCPVDYFATPALGLAGGAIGLSVNLRINTTWTEAPDLTVASVGPAGSKKSPCLKVLTRPHNAIDRELRQKYIKDKDEYKTQKREWDLKARGKENPGPEPVAPAHGHLTVDDTTREAVTYTHSQNPRGLIVVMDELSAWVASLNAYRNGKGDDRQFWMKVRSGSLVKVTRKGNPEPLVIARPMVPVVGCITPSMLPSLGQGPDDGWLDRILFGYPDPDACPPRGYTEAEISQEALDDWDKAIRRLWGREMVVDEVSQARPFFVKLTEGARNQWARWVDAHCAEMRAPGFDKSLAGPWSKMEGFTLRLALILSQLHWAYDPTSRNDRPPDVSHRDIEWASRLAAYFKAHFRRVKAELAGEDGALSEDARAAIDWIRRNRKSSFSENEVNEALGRFRGQPKRRAIAMTKLIETGCIDRRPAPPRTGKRGRPPSPAYDVNPAIYAGEHSEKSGAGPAEPGSSGISLNKLNILNTPKTSEPGTVLTPSPAF